MYTILIVDDEVGLSYALETVLEYAGYHTLVVQSCSEAKSLLTHTRPDLIILSKQQSDIDCADLGTMLKLCNVSYSIPLVVYGKSDYLDNLLHKHKLEPDATLMRPASSSALLEKVRHLLSKVADSNRALPHTASI